MYPMLNGPLDGDYAPPGSLGEYVIFDIPQEPIYRFDGARWVFWGWNKSIVVRIAD